MMKTISKNFLFSIILLISCSISLKAENWVLGSRQFNLKQKKGADKKAEQIEKVLPQLILEQFAENFLRTISYDEELDRELNKLQTERLSLFLQLSKEEKVRDAFVLSKDNPNELKKEIAKQTAKIKEIQKKIDDNLLVTEETKEKYLKKEQNYQQVKKNSFGFFLGKTEIQALSSEGISLYKNDTSALFMPSENAINDGINSYAYVKEVNASSINGLLNGDILIYGDYCSVSVSLYVYPGARYAGTVTEVGNTNDLMSIAQAVARNLTPKIANSKPVTIRFEIEPEEAAENAVYSIDSIIVNFNSDQKETVVDSGIHSITISSSGYETQTINYSFAGEEVFTVKAKMKGLSDGTIPVYLSKFREGIFSFNGLDSDKIEKENDAGTAYINGKSVLGVFTDIKGDKAFIYLPKDLMLESEALSLKVKPYDRAQNIDKRRRRMYTAYSALICSLPFTFYCVGNLNATGNAYNESRGSFEDAMSWQKKSYITIGISCTAGAWFAVEMVRYLVAANEVLPAKAKSAKLRPSVVEEQNSEITVPENTELMGEIMDPQNKTDNMTITDKSEKGE